MRDPKRIRPMCEAIADAWEKNCPDWRFGQLVENICRAGGRMQFFVEDEEFMKLLNEMLTRPENE